MPMKTKPVHFIGIGGIGVSALAKLMQAEGAKVSGSDTTSSVITRSFKNSKISYKHKATNITKKHKLVIYSPAISPDNPELLQARKLKIKTLSYPEALGAFAKKYKLIAISGSHGKSTTTAIVSLILQKNKLDPTVVIGTKLKEFGMQNFRIGKSKFLVVEACEYKRSFLNLHPYITIITNVETDHLDYFKDDADYLKAFNELAKQTTGYVVINPNDKDSIAATKGIKAKVVPINLKGHTLTLKDKKIHIKPGIIGGFNVTNSALAAQAAALLGLKPLKIAKAIKFFHGTWRRMEYKKTKLKTPFIDDYAHHPTEIKATLATIRAAHPKAKILCVYQPHQYNRTHHFLGAFGASFSDVNEVIIPNIYEVRDSASDVATVSPDDLVAEIKKNKTKASNGGGLASTAKWLKKNHKKYGLIVTMGAGDVDRIYGWL